MLEFLVGPLVGPECRRCLGRRWLAWAGVLAALPASGIVLAVAWVWFLKLQLNPVGVPGGLLSGTLVALDVVAIAIAFVLTPALLAGVLAGERVRGTLELLLAAEVNARDIILGRLMGRLSQVGILLAAGLPCWVLTLTQAGIPFSAGAALTLLPLAVAWGAGGMAMAASVSARRGRDALIGVYFVEAAILAPGVFLLFSPMVLWGSILCLNPFSGLAAAAWHGQALPAWTSIAWWSVLGALGTAWAGLRLRPVYLRRTGSGAPPRRRGRVPAMGERPMLWKELHIERAKALGRVGRLLGWLVIAVVLGGSVWMAAWMAWCALGYGSSGDVGAVRDLFTFWITSTQLPLAWIIQWGVGLRAGVTVATEREQGTWEALILSPLEAGEIVRGKVLGSMHALRGLAAAGLAAWTLALATGALGTWDYVQIVAGLGVMVFFMATVGVTASLVCKSSTGAMAVTLAVWLASLAVFSLAALIVSGLLAALVSLLTLALEWLTGMDPAPFLSALGPGAFPALWTVTNWTLYLLAGLGLIAYGRCAFDRLAGRLPTDPLRAAFFRERYARWNGAAALEEDLADAESAAPTA